MAAAIGFGLWTKRWPYPNPAQDHSSQVQEPTRDVVAAVGAALERVPGLDWETELTLRFSDRLDEPTRDAVMAAVRASYVDAFEASYADAVVETVVEMDDIDPRLGPTFMLHDGGDIAVLGLWPDPRTFCIIPYSERHPWPEEAVLVMARHWHPDSMISGSWGSRLTIVVPGVLHEIRDWDDLGREAHFRPAPAEPEALAREILAHLRESSIHEAEVWIPILYSLIGPDLDDLCPFFIDVLPDTTNHRYEITGMYVNATGPTSEALRRLGAPTDEQREALCASIRAYFTGGQNPFGDVQVPDEWQAVVDAAERR